MGLRLVHYMDIETVYDSPERAGQFVGIIDDLRDGGVSGGWFGGHSRTECASLVSEGDQVLDVLDTLDPAAEVFGNHDFDLGMETIRNVVASSPQVWVNSNLDHPSGVLEHAGAARHTTVERGSVTVGFVGVTTPDLPEMNHHASSLRVQDPVSTVNEYVPRLRATRGVDFVVVLSHLGTEEEFVESIDVDVDAVLGGHNHEPLATVIDGVPVSRPGANGTHVVEVTLGRSPAVTLQPVSRTPPDTDTRKRIERFISRTGLNKPIATVSEPISLEKEHGARGERRIGNFVTDAYRWRAQADEALLAARAVHTGDRLEGEITPFELTNVIPFNDSLVSVELSGESLLEAFQELDHADAPTLRDRYFGHVSGAELVWNRHRTLESVAVDGEPVDPSATDAVATTSYFVQTGHIFSAFGTEDVVDSVCPQHEAVLEYAREDGIEPTIEGRIVRPDEAAELHHR